MKDDSYDSIPPEQDNLRFLAETAYQQAEAGYQRGETPLSAVRLAGIARAYARRGKRLPPPEVLNEHAVEFGI